MLAFLNQVRKNFNIAQNDMTSTDGHDAAGDDRPELPSLAAWVKRWFPIDGKKTPNNSCRSC